MKHIGLVLILLCSAVAGPGQARGVWVPAELPIGRDDLSRYKGPDGGQLVLSFAALAGGLGLVGLGPTSFNITFHKVEGAGEGHVHGGTSNIWPPRFHDESPAPTAGDPAHATVVRRFDGVVMTDQVPPGHYEVTSIALLTNNSEQDLGPFKIPFEIHPGRTTYIGEFRAFRQERKRVIGLNAITGWTVAVSDQSARDLPLLASKTKTEVNPADIQVFKVQSLGLPYLRDAP